MFVDNRSLPVTVQNRAVHEYAEQGSRTGAELSFSSRAEWFLNDPLRRLPSQYHSCG